MLSVALLTGGSSSERDVALASAANVAGILEKRFRVSVFDFPEDIERFVATRKKFAAAVPIFHGKGGEDGVVQGFLKMLGMPFIFSDVAAHAIGLNKAWTKLLVADAGIRVPPARTVSIKDRVIFKNACVIKPIDGGSSIGVTIAKDARAFAKGLRAAFRQSENVLIEKFVSGEEFTVAVIQEKKKNVALPVIAIKPKTGFFDYQSKYKEGLAEEICPAKIPVRLARALQDIAVAAHQIIGARHLSRSDFIVDARGRVWFLEINTIPGQTLHSLVPQAIRASGRDVADVFADWIYDVAG